ncbi:hypothetical protein CW304_23520 [Bacillus sp. UFRGS-B20]|nr:hypothetical protein CW304_23520 [Bacillus sp. UFRGS-B20]
MYDSPSLGDTTTPSVDRLAKKPPKNPFQPPISIKTGGTPRQNWENSGVKKTFLFPKYFFQTFASPKRVNLGGGRGFLKPRGIFVSFICF